MVSTFTSNIGLEKQGTGDNNDTWGEELNENFDQIDAAIGGKVSISMSIADVTLTESQYRNRRIEITGALTANRNLILPSLLREWVIDNRTSDNGNLLTAKTSGGSGVICPAGQITEVMGDNGSIISKEVLHTEMREIYGGTTAGSSTAYTANRYPAPTGLTAGLIVTGFWHTQSGATPTFNLNGLGAHEILDWTGAAPASGALLSGTRFALMHNGVSSWYLMSPNGAARLSSAQSFAGTQTFARIDMTGSINRAEGASVASASSPNIWAHDGDTIHITGTTTITGFAAAPQAGAWKELIFDGALQVTQGANLITQGGINLFIAAGDRAMVYAETTTQFRFWHMPASYAPVQYPPLRGYIDGLILENDITDAANDLQIKAGMATDDAAAVMMVLSSAIIKRLDAGWAVGTNQGGLDTGSEATSTWYHVWLIRRPDTGVVDVLFSASATSPTMPTNYTQKRRIGAFFNNSGSAIEQFIQLGDQFLWDVPPLDVNVNNQGPSPVNYTLRVPTGIILEAIYNIAMGDAANQAIIVQQPGTTNATPSFTAAPLATIRSGVSFVDVHGPKMCRTNTSAQVKITSTAASTDLAISTLGWNDPRGRDA